MHERQSVRRQYAATDPLAIRRETHRLYEERPVDLDHEAVILLALNGDEAILDVGPGPGRFERHLRSAGHRGVIAGADLSRAMVCEAREGVSGSEAERTHWLLGLAEHLPVADAAFDVVVARHMLYHVPDIDAALCEFRRVLRPDGRLLVSTNAYWSLPGVTTLMSDMLLTFGLPPEESIQAPFSMDNAEPILTSVFPIVESFRIENALLFTEPEPIVNYLVTLFPSLPSADDPGITERMRDWLSAEAIRRLAERGGVWRDPKDVGFYVCRIADPT